MGPNKLEIQIREKLDLREIQPSAPAWDRLDAMLSVAEEKKTRKPFGFLFIAASILVFVTLGLFLFNQNETEMNPMNTVVGAETKIDTVQNSTEKNQNPIIEKSQEKQVVINQFQSSPEAQPNSLERSGKNQKTNTNQNPIINRSKEIEYQNSSDVAQKELPKVMEQKEIIVRKGISPKTDDSLLADLDQSAAASSNKKTNVKVDAKSLLSEVDGEVEYTFREKMLKKINKNYQEVKVALANRNNE